MAKSNKKLRNIKQNFVDRIYATHYVQKPPNIEEFLCSKEYVGSMTHEGKDIFPCWWDALKVVATEDSKYIYVLTGAAGTGKSYCAVLGSLYTCCKLLCLKDAYNYFGLAKDKKFTVIFFNLTKTTSESQDYFTFQQHLLNSPWFRKHGKLRGSEANPRLEFDLLDFGVASPLSQGFGLIGFNVISIILDEVDAPTATKTQKEKVISAFEESQTRFENRIVRDGETLGRIFLVSSKQDRLSFLNTFIAKQKTMKAKNLVVVDVSIWEAKKNAGLYSGDLFPVMIGDSYTPSKILDSDCCKAPISEQKVNKSVQYICTQCNKPCTIESLKEALHNNFSVVHPPIELLTSFQSNVVKALKDLAGVTVAERRLEKLFPTEHLISACYDKERLNPVKIITIEIGLRDKVDLADYIDFSAIRIPRNIPRYIHNDYAYARGGNASGLAMSCVSGWQKQNIQNPDGTFRVVKSPVAETDFVMRLVAKEGDRIPQNKIMKLVLDLKEVFGFNISLYTSDLPIGSQTNLQTLELAGVPCESFSVDKNSQWYREFRNVVAEKRWVCFYHPYLHFELKNLEDDPTKNKIDHPDEVVEIEFMGDGSTKEVVMLGSKDLADPVCASVMNALEKTKEPPDVEIIKKMYQRNVKPNIPTITQDFDWILPQINQDKGIIDMKGNDKPKTNNIVDIYKNLLDIANAHSRNKKEQK